MKRIFFPLLLVVMAAFPSLRSYAQDEPVPGKKTDWVSDKGYWVVETNKQTPKETVIYFYSNKNLLVYKKEVKEQKLNLSKPATLLQLKATLEDAVAAYENGVAANKEKQAIHLVNN